MQDSLFFCIFRIILVLSFVGFFYLLCFSFFGFLSLPAKFFHCYICFWIALLGFYSAFHLIFDDKSRKE